LAGAGGAAAQQTQNAGPGVQNALADNIISRIASFNNVVLRGGYRINSLQLTDKPIIGPGGLQKLGSTGTNLGTGAMDILISSNQSNRQISITIYHEVLEAALYQAGPKAPPAVSHLVDNETGIDALARSFYNQLGIASVENLNKMLESLGF
jgi:hypothetical protein